MTPSRNADLVPVDDRYRWLLCCRVLIVALLAMLVAGAADPAAGRIVSLAGAAWLGLTALLYPLTRRYRRATRASITLGLLGDGVLLAAGWWLLGAPGNAVEALVFVHVVGTTLLASFRTGVKLALWHSLVALVVLECAAGGLLGGDPEPLPVVRAGIYVGSLCLITVLTAAFAAVNERELRRRRYDSEVLRQFGVTLVAHQPPIEVLRTLATFARDELLAQRAVVVAYPREADGSQTGSGYAIVVGPDHDEVVGDALAGAALNHRVRDAEPGAAPVLLRRVDPEADPDLARLLPDTRNLVVLPFALEQVTGFVAVAGDDWPKHRIERRVVATLQQATMQATMALSRTLLNERIQHAAETDPLTGLANRGTFTTSLDGALADQRDHGRDFALVLLDLDHFKRLNDTYGHQTGDDVLKATAVALRSECREGDLAARYGGEEFAVILAGRSPAEARDAAERIRAAIAGAPTAVPVTASVGIAMSPAAGRDARTLIAAADGALYDAKHAGRNRVVQASAELKEQEGNFTLMPVISSMTS